MAKPDPELEIYARGGGAYDRARRHVDAACRIAMRPCIGEPCDLGAPCKRHARSHAVAARYVRLWERIQKG